MAIYPTPSRSLSGQKFRQSKNKCMTPELATAYITGRMNEMGIRDYYIKTRHFVLSPNKVRTEKAPAQFFVLAQPKENVRIESSTGGFDMAEINANELQYEHQGQT